VAAECIPSEAVEIDLASAAHTPSEASEAVVGCNCRLAVAVPFVVVSPFPVVLPFVEVAPYYQGDPFAEVAPYEQGDSFDKTVPLDKVVPFDEAAPSAAVVEDPIPSGFEPKRVEEETWDRDCLGFGQTLAPLLLA